MDFLSAIISDEEIFGGKENIPQRNNTSYPLYVKNLLASVDATSDPKLRPHQFIPSHFFGIDKGRGQLFVHAMGTGKTRLAVSITEHYRTKDPKRRIIILLPKSLEDNFRHTITSYSGSESAQDSYKFVSMNASNMFVQISSIHKSKEEKKRQKELEDFEDVPRLLDNSLLVVDEAHNLFNSITNGSKNGLRLYDLIMNSKNLKLVFLTGTPVINDPFELVPCFNMLHGSILFPEKIDLFREYFVCDNKFKNQDKFMNRIYGLTSYYGNLYFPSVDRPGFPRRLPAIVEKIPMSAYQYTAYIVARNMELEESSVSYRTAASRFAASSGGNSTYRVKSRQISNYAIPEYALGPIRGRKSRTKHIEKITGTDLVNLKKFSPKFEKIMENIGKSEGIGLVYSQFVSGEGIGIFARVLEAFGWVNFNNANLMENQKNRGVFAILSGSILPEDRTILISRINSKENMDGSKIKLLLLSGAVAEGIDLKRIRHVHIMEPFWNYARINQVATRAVRFGSHEDLPEEQREVQTYIYLSDHIQGKEAEKALKKAKADGDEDDSAIKESTTDVTLYEKSIKNMELINEFMLALARTSIDCFFHKKDLDSVIGEKIKCKLCAPTGKKLFHASLETDMDLPSPCQKFNESKVKAKEFEHEGTKYFYTSEDDKGSGLKIFYWNPAVKGYMQMNNRHPLYGALLAKLHSEHSFGESILDD
jgi:thymidine kinase